MAFYELFYVDGQKHEIDADNDADAEAEALAIVGADAVACEQWESAGWSDDDDQIERLLIWECEEDSIDDPGVNAIAQLTVIRERPKR